MAGNRVNIIITARNATAAAFRAVRNSTRDLSRHMVRHLRNAGSDGVRAFGNGFRGGIGNAFAMAMRNPYLATIILGTGSALGSLLGAAIAGALVLAWGSMFVGMGIAFALQNKKIRKEWSTTLKAIGKEYKTLSKPMEEVLTTARLGLKDMADSFAPHFKKAMETSAPYVSTFIDHLVKGFKSMGKKAFAPMMNGFNELLSALGPEVEDFMGELGDAFALLGAVVGANKTEIANAIHIILSLITGLIYVIATLAQSWGMMSRAAATAINGVQNAFQSMSEGCAAAAAAMITGIKAAVSGILTAVASVLDGLARFNDAIGMHGIADDMKGAASAVRGFRDSANSTFDSAKAAVDRFNQRVKDAGKVRHLKMDIAGWKAKISEAEARLKHVPKSKQSKLKADIASLKAKVAEAQAKINGLRGRTVGIGIAYHITNPGLLAAAHGRRSGGNVGAAASGGARNNLTMVGENGPELVRLPGGSHVSSNPDTRRKMAGGGGGGGPTVIEFKTDGTKASKMLLELLRESVRSQGGNVQLVVGGRRAA